MRNSNKISTLALTLCAVFASGSAFAEKQLSANVSNIHLRLIDLNTNDGITPDLQFTAGYLYEYYSYSNPMAGANRYFDGPTQGNDAYTYSYDNSAGNAQSQSSGGLLANLQINNVLYNNPTYTSIYHQLANSSYFVLSPNTGLEVSFDSSISLTRSPLSHWDAGNYVQANVLVYDYWWSQNVGAGSFSDLNRASPQHIADSSHHVLRFDNNHNYSMTGVLSTTTIVSMSDEGFAAPVPEPETYAMMLGGLAMLGALARRRRRQ